MTSILKTTLLMSMSILMSCGQNNGSNDASSNPVEVPKDNTKTEVSTEKASFKVTALRKTIFNPDFSNLEEFKKNINDYIIKFEATAGSYKNTQVECQKAFTRSSRKNYTAFDQKGLTASMEVSIDQNDKNSVVFNCSILQDDTEIDSAKFTLNKSVVISDEVTFGPGIGDGNLDTIVIDEKGNLVSNGESIKVTASTLISNKGKISTFKKDVISSPENIPGLPGNVMFIYARKAYGEISIELRGLNGGTQTIGPGPQTALHNPPKARNGQCADGVRPSNEALCRGQDGLRGLQGLQGLKGQDGGDSGFVDFIVLENTDLKVSINLIPGKGSLGGPGGEGGKGQLGGSGNRISWVEGSTDCTTGTCLQKSRARKVTRSYPNGKDGDIGAKGNNGPSGSAGRIRASSIFINEEHLIIKKDWSNL